MNLLRGAVARAQLLVCWLSRLGTLPALLGDAPPGVDAPSPLPRLPFGLCLTTGSSLSWQPFLLCFSEWDSVAVGVPSALSFDSVCIAATLSSCASVVVVMIAVMASFFPTLWIWASECLQDRSDCALLSSVLPRIRTTAAKEISFLLCIRSEISFLLCVGCVVRSISFVERWCVVRLGWEFGFPLAVNNVAW